MKNSSDNVNRSFRLSEIKKLVLKFILKIKIEEGLFGLKKVVGMVLNKKGTVDINNNLKISLYNKQ